MTEGKVASNTQTVVQRLEDLRTEHMSLINSLESPNSKAVKSDIILKNIKYIDVGLDEAQLMMEFTSHLQNVEIEKQKLNLQIKQLSQENNMLRDENAELNGKLQSLETIVAAFDNLNLEMRLTCCDKIDPVVEVTESFSDELLDADLTPRASNQTESQGNNEYEHLIRFKDLQNLAVSYALEGKYDVAVPVCQQALENLEKTTIGRYHPYVKTMMSILALVYGVQSKYKLAAQVLNDAIREQTHPNSSESNQILAVKRN